MISGVQKSIEYLVKNFEFDTVLDLGCGPGEYHKFFSPETKITGVDCTPRISPLPNVTFVENDIFGFNDGQFDCALASHCIEHIPDTESFLNHFFSLIKEDGVFCLLYPKLKQTIVGGHVHIFNLGLLMYNIVRIGIDCSDAKMIRNGYTEGIIGYKRSFEVPNLRYNKDDLALLKGRFPFNAHHDFNGKNPPGVIEL